MLRESRNQRNRSNSGHESRCTRLIEPFHSGFNWPRVRRAETCFDLDEKVAAKRIPLSLRSIRQFLIENVWRGCKQVHIFLLQAIENVLSIGKKYPLNTHANDQLDYECWCRPPNGSLPSSYDTINWTALDQKACQVNPARMSNKCLLAEITCCNGPLILRRIVLESLARYHSIHKNGVNFLPGLQWYASGR